MFSCLCAVINAENAGHKCEKFRTMAQRTRQEYLKDLATNFSTTNTLDSGSKLSKQALSLTIFTPHTLLFKLMMMMMTNEFNVLLKLHSQLTYLYLFPHAAAKAISPVSWIASVNTFDRLKKTPQSAFINKN